MTSGDLYKVWEIKTLKRKDGEAEARKILERIAKQVQPIMRKHNWRVKVLSEFCPKNPSLLGLNVNGGVHVKLRLRRPNRDWDFYPFYEVLDTMLHELCHNAHGPHNALFYKLWDDLREECDKLITKGITGSGEGFDLPGRRLGGFSRQPPISSLRNTAVAAAQKRARLGSLLPSGPKRLGGDSSMMAALTPVQAAAMAAERRLHDEIWCASGSSKFEEEENTDNLLQNHIGQSDGRSTACHGRDAQTSETKSRKRSHESFKSSSLSHSSSLHTDPSVVDLIAVTSVSGSKQNPSYKTEKKSQSMNGHGNSSFIDLTGDVSTSATIYYQDCKHDADSSTWECATCTLMNPPLALICEVCDTLKPRDVKDKYKFWPCKFCTLENSVKSDKCIACNQWRYSHGAPVAAPAPNLGT